MNEILYVYSLYKNNVIVKLNVMNIYTIIINYNTLVIVIIIVQYVALNV